ncbi:hypothetical protein BJQ76_02675 [Klebsiella pneumoniae]|nr:hypothetical protein [Klebsiella pneumoniae]
MATTPSVPSLPELPSVPTTILPAIAELTAALGIPRNVLASDEEISFAWQDLPRELRLIPSDLRGELVARMCVAVSAGLFDGAMNYIWNAAILQIRQKVRNFGLPIVSQMLQSDFEEKHLIDLQDSKLLELALKLNLVNEDGYFFLDHCREMRNNFSAAHPTIGNINDREFTTFLNRCVRYALADASSPRGVNVADFIASIKSARFTGQQCAIWIQRINDTHAAQRQILIGMVHGIYCDPNTSEPARLNAIDLCSAISEQFTAAIRSDLINKHAEYAAKGDEPRHTASTQFFEKLGQIRYLSEADQHIIFYRAIERLWNAHNGMNNFYNEPPFAERLCELATHGAVPETVQEYFVQVVVACAIGNGYGVSHGALSYYTEMIRTFSPREIATMIRLYSDRTNIVGYRIATYSRGRERFKEYLRTLDPASISSGVRSDYDRILRE